MAFQPDDYIFHNEYGVGKIVSVSEGANPEASIYFETESTSSLPIYLLDRNASKLSPEGFRVFAYLDPDSAHALLHDDPAEAICRVLEDFPGYKAKTEDLKDYLAPYLPDWDPWWKITQPKLKQDVRIDTSKSKLREYGIHRGVLTKAGEAYLSFRRLRNFEDTTRVYAQALQVLGEIQRNSELPEKDQAELLTYLKGIILSPKAPIAIRIDALFRLRDGKHILDEDFISLINRLIDEKFCLYDLGQYALNHLLDVLLSRSSNDHELDLLATGMCTGKDVIGKLVDWALARADPQIISVFLITAFSENVHNALDQNKYEDFLARLNGCISLVRGMPKTSNMWPKIYASFDHMVEVFAGNYPVTEIQYLLPGLVRLATELHDRVGNVMENDTEAVLRAMANPGVRLEFILACLDIAEKNNSTQHYASDMETYLLYNADRRSLDIIKPLINRKNLTSIEQAAELTQLIKSFPNSQYIFNKVEELLCKLGTQATDSELLALRPYLDIFHDSSSASSGNTCIEILRERAFILLFEADFSQIESTQYPLDLALLAAVGKYLKTQMANAERKIINERQINQELQSQIQELDHLLREKEKLLNEMRSTHGGDTRAAYFAERTRILRDLVGTVAEFERFVASHPARSTEVDAILLRLSNLISAHKVSPLEDINSQVPFNPQKHRLAEGTSVSIDDPVIVLERGYVIRDHKEKLRLLKPAIVKSLEQDELGR